VGDHSAIESTEATWNPTTGCDYLDSDDPGVNSEHLRLVRRCCSQPPKPLGVML